MKERYRKVTTQVNGESVVIGELIPKVGIVSEPPRRSVLGSMISSLRRRRVRYGVDGSMEAAGWAIHDLHQEAASISPALGIATQVVGDILAGSGVVLFMGDTTYDLVRWADRTVQKKREQIIRRRQEPPRRS